MSLCRFTAYHVERSVRRMVTNRGISTIPYYTIGLLIAAVCGAVAVLSLQLYKRQIVRQTLLNMREFNRETSHDQSNELR